MWKKCRSVFNEPVKVFVWEWEEAVLGLLLFGVGQFFVGPFWSTALAAGLLGLIYKLKKGQPAGAVWHWLHRVKFPCFQLPGVLPSEPQVYSPWP